MTAPTRNKFERWSGGMPLAAPVAFGAVLVIASVSSKLGGSSLFFFAPLAFVTSGTMVWLGARRDPTRDHLAHVTVGSGLLVGCGVVVAVCGLAGGLMLDSPTFWASIAVVAAIAAPISAGISPFSSPRG